VVNGDFELYDTCPLTFSTPGDVVINYTVQNWETPTHATSDYYNTCATGNVGIPSNLVGYQLPNSGNAYTGLYTYSIFNGPSLWSEYIQGKINPPLNANKTYLVSFYVSKSGYIFAASMLGAYLSVNQISRPDPLPFEGYSPQVLNPPGNFITDTTGWVQIQGNYTATGGEKYITIGWWGGNITTDSMNTSTIPAVDPVAYYYVDDVSIIEDTNAIYINTPNVFTPNNDGINDNWLPDFQNITQFDLIIYNRWGTPVFTGDQNKYIWDGNCGNQQCSDGTYFYVIQGIDTDNKKIRKKGFIQLFDGTNN